MFGCFWLEESELTNGNAGLPLNRYQIDSHYSQGMQQGLSVESAGLQIESAGGPPGAQYRSAHTQAAHPIMIHRRSGCLNRPEQ